MSGIFGGSSSGSSGSPGNIQPGPFTFGPTSYDLGLDQKAQSNSLLALTNRNKQLGVQTQPGDIRSIAQQGQALQGMQQLAEENQPATNPALQNVQTTPQQPSGVYGSLGSLAGSAAAGLGGSTAASSLTGGASGVGAGTGSAIDAAQAGGFLF